MDAATGEAPPWKIGLRAAKANVKPGLLIQVMMLAIVLAYYGNEPTRRALDVLAGFKQHWGYWFTIALSIFAGAFLSEFFKVCFFQRGRVRMDNLREFVFSAVFWAFLGCAVDTLYRLQGTWFGTTPTVGALVKKVLVDQLIYNSLFAAPVTVWAYEWKNRGYALSGNADFFTLRFYCKKIFPTLIATWGLWFPTVSIIYALPPLLQIPLFGLALSFWVLLVTYINARRQT